MNGTEFEGISFDLFGTLVAVKKPANPAEAVATELATEGLRVPDDWHAAYAEPHVDVPKGREYSLAEHVSAALASRADSLRPEDVRENVERAVLAAFETEVRTRPGALKAVETVPDRVPVGVLSNCSVPGLVERTLAASALDVAAFDAVVTSVDCGWRKPHPRAFAAVADELGIPVDGLFHVGDDPETDGGAAGATSRIVDDGSLAGLPIELRGKWA